MICAVADVCIHTRKWTHRPTNSLSSLAEMQMLPGAWNTGVCRAFALTTHMEGTGITSSSPVGSRVLLAAFVRLCTFFLLTRWWFKNHEWYILHWFKKILIQPNGHDDQVRTCCYPTAPSQKLGATRTSMFWTQLYVVIPSHAVLLCAIGKWAVSLGKIWERHVVSGHTIVLALLCAWTCVHSGTTFIGTIRFYAAMEVLLWQHCLCFPAAKILYMCKPKPRKKVMSLAHSKTKKLQIISTRTIGKIVQKSEYFIPRPISKIGMLAKPREKIFDQKLQVFRETIMMRHYGVQSLKPTCLRSNSYHLRDLNLGPLPEKLRSTCVALATTYTDARGVKRCVGKKKILKASQTLDYCLSCCYIYPFIILILTWTHTHIREISFLCVSEENANTHLSFFPKLEKIIGVFLVCFSSRSFI